MAAMDVSTKDLLSIGRFSRVTGLTVKALRHYGELGLLEPAYVDDETGYRYYRPHQIADGETIRRLRALGVSLDGIRPILAATDAAEIRRRLIGHRAALERRAADTSRILDELTRLIDGKEELVPTTDVLYEIAVKEFPEQRVLRVGERVPPEELKHVIPAAYKELFAYLAELGEEAVEPWTVTVCPFPDDDGMVDIVNAVVTAEPLPGRGRIESGALPACTAVCLLHKGPYEELGRSYKLLSQWINAHGLETADAPREIYWTDPEETPDPADYVTEIAWPIVRDEAKLTSVRAGVGDEKLTRPLPA